MDTYRQFVEALRDHMEPDEEVSREFLRRVLGYLDNYSEEHRRGVFDLPLQSCCGVHAMRVTFEMMALTNQNLDVINDLAHACVHQIVVHLFG